MSGGRGVTNSDNAGQGGEGGGGLKTHHLAAHPL